MITDFYTAKRTVYKSELSLENHAA